jgi:hypothetical protein
MDVLAIGLFSPLATVLCLALLILPLVWGLNWILAHVFRFHVPWMRLTLLFNWLILLVAHPKLLPLI